MVRRLSDEDYSTLKASIGHRGIDIPLIVWKHDKRLIVLSGLNRLGIAEELGLKTAPVIIRKFADEHAAKLFAVSDNLARRQLTVGQRAYLAYQYQHLIAVGAGRPRKGVILTKVSKLNSRQSAAGKAGVSEGTLSAMKMIVESGDKNLLQSVLNGRQTLHGAARAVKNNNHRPKPKHMPRAERQSRCDATTLIHGDCRRELKKIASASIDVILSDVPYPGIDRPYGKMTEAAWLEMMKEVTDECRRILKPTGSMVIILQPNFEKVGQMRLWAWRWVLWAAEKWNLVQDIYWWCVNTPPTHAANRRVGLLRQSVKWLAWFGSPNCYRNQDAVLWEPSNSMDVVKWEDRCLRQLPSTHTIRRGRIAEAASERGGATPFNLIPISAASPAEHRGHPASTPYALAAWWCRYILPSGGVLLDPFCGSGTMLTAGLDHGASRVIGIDKEKKYLRIAKRRITNG